MSLTPQRLSATALVFFTGIVLVACQDSGPKDKRIKSMIPDSAAQLAKRIESTVTPQLAEGVTFKLFGGDSLVADPIAIDIDDNGKIYYTRTNRQKNSEFDIRGHQDWEIGSIQLKNVEEKRAFLHDVLSPANSKKNDWLKDLNGDGSHDWKDMTIEKEHIYRIEDTNGDGVADKSQLVVEDFNDEITDVAGGVMIDGEDLFVAVGPDLWRMKDKNGDGLADEKTSISHGYGIHIGFGGHGMSGIEMGPEGKIYWQIGDIGFSGTGPDGQKWEHPNSGVIVRSNPDGSDFEVFSYGNRNTHEFVFDEYGNLISEDNDGDHAGERERLVYIVNGSDTGWRTNWQFGKYRDPDNNTYKVWMDEKMYLPRFEGQAAYITPTLANYVSGPAGMVYNPGTALGPDWKNTFFIVEFVGNPARSGIHAFKLKPKGASFDLAETKPMVMGVAATGLDFGPDGALYVADWISGWDTKEYGRIWKVDVENQFVEERKQTQKLLADDFKKYDDTQLSDLLRNADMRVRQKAQFELVTRGNGGLNVFKSTLADKQNQFARIHAVWGISQFARKDMKHAALFVPLLKDEDPELRAQAAKWIGDVKYKDAGNDLLPLLKDEYPRARFFAAEALGRISFEPAVQPVIDLLRNNNDEDVLLRHAGSLALARIGKPGPVIALSKDESRAVRIAAVVALRRMKNPGIAAFLNDQDEFVVTETARAINDDLSIPEALPALADLLSTTKFSNEALIRRSINANLRVGSEKTMMNLINYTMQKTAPVAMRSEAMDALSTWSKPSVLDRVDGRFRGKITRDPLAVNNASADPLIELATNSDAALRLHAVNALGKMKIEKGSEQLFARLKTDKDPAIKVAALRALAAMNDKKIDVAIKQALADNDKTVRIAGIDLLSKMDISKDLMVSLLSNAINTRTTEEKQAALLTLGKVPVSNSQKVFDDLLAKMKSNKLPHEIYLELGEAIDSTHSKDLISRYKEISSSLSPDSTLSAFESALVGGDADQGRRTFFRNQTAQCLRCHSYDDVGGNAGPRLNGVATRLKREQILEALIKPSARIAPGFGTVTLEMKDGKKLNGILQQEKPTDLILKIGDKQDTVIRKDMVAKRTNGGSSMPPMGLILSKREIRDLVSFLSTLKDE
jgi:quinoprotein glucose dehydrogenase